MRDRAFFFFIRFNLQDILQSLVIHYSQVIIILMTLQMYKQKSNYAREWGKML